MPSDLTDEIEAIQWTDEVSHWAHWTGISGTDRTQFVKWR